MDNFYENVQKAKLLGKATFKIYSKSPAVQTSLKTMIQNMDVMSKRISDTYTNIEKEHVFNNTVLKQCRYNQQLNSICLFSSRRVMKSLVKKMKKEPFLTTSEYSSPNRPTIRIHHFSNISDKIIEKICERILSVLIMFNKNMDVNLYLFLTNCRKRYDFSKNVISPSMVNSAVTSFYQNPDDNNIIIMRNEELPKVLIHELIHYLRIDNSAKNHITNYLQQRYPINNLNGDLLYNEAWTETLATLYNVAYICPNESELTKYVTNEYNHGLEKSNTILRGFGSNVSYFNKGLTPTINETTAATSYNIVKTMHLSDPDAFLRNMNNPGALLNILRKSKLAKFRMSNNNYAKMTFYGNRF